MSKIVSGSKYKCSKCGAKHSEGAKIAPTRLDNNYSLQWICTKCASEAFLAIIAQSKTKENPM